MLFQCLCALLLLAERLPHSLDVRAGRGLSPDHRALCTCDRVTTHILHPVPPRLLNPLMSFPFVQQKVTAADRGVWLCVPVLHLPSDTYSHTCTPVQPQRGRLKGFAADRRFLWRKRGDKCELRHHLHPQCSASASCSAWGPLSLTSASLPQLGRPLWGALFM